MNFDNKKIKRKIRRDEALDLSKEVNLRAVVFKNKKKYNRKKKYKKNDI